MGAHLGFENLTATTGTSHPHQGTVVLKHGHAQWHARVQWHGMQESQLPAAVRWNEYAISYRHFGVAAGRVGFGGGLQQMGGEWRYR